MHTQEQAQDLYEKLSSILDVIDEKEQYGLWCVNWLIRDDIFGKQCSCHCPFVHAAGTCAIDEARALVKKVEGL